MCEFVTEVPAHAMTTVHDKAKRWSDCDGDHTEWHDATIHRWWVDGQEYGVWHWDKCRVAQW